VRDGNSDRVTDALLPPPVAVGEIDGGVLRVPAHTYVIPATKFSFNG
jgi:hypothetical protein